MAIIKQGSGWGVRVYRDKKRTWMGTFPTEERAKEVEAAFYRGEELHEETCDDFAVRWLTEYVTGKASTFQTYYYALTRFREDFCGVSLRGPLSRSPFAQREGHRGNDRQIARIWATKYPGRRSVVRAMFEDARRDGLIDQNPFTNLRLPGSRGRKDLNPLRSDELHRLASLAFELHDERTALTMNAATLTLGYVGLRVSELFALRWSDLQGDEIRISRRAYNGVFDAPKNGKARTVICPAPALEAISKVTRRIGQELIFTTPRGQLFRSYTFSRYFERQAFTLEAEVGVERAKELRSGRAKNATTLTPHELRHFAASHLLDLGASPEMVAQQLGHSDGGQLVMSRYGHPNEKLQRERLRAVIGQNVTEPQRVLAHA